jgi:hypothetical protein
MIDITLSLKTQVLDNQKDKLLNLLLKLEDNGYDISINNELLIEFDFNDIDKQVEYYISNFLSKIDFDLVTNSSLQVGIFFSVNKYAFFNFECSKKLLNIFVKNNIEFEISIYPIRESEDRMCD